MLENDRVKKVRKALSMTLVDFGGKLGVTKGAISAIENGARGLTDQMCRSICREFGVSEIWLRTGEGEMFTRETSDEVEALAIKYDLSQRSKILVEQFVTLRSEIQEGIIDFIESVAHAFAELDTEQAEAEQSIDAKVEAYRRQLIEEQLNNPVKPVADMTDEELLDEVKRQLALEKEQAAESSAFGHGSSGTATA